MKTDKNTSNAILSTVEEAVRVHTEALNTAENAVNDAKWRKDVANAALEKAVETNDAAAFAEAKSQIAEAENALDLAERRITMLREAGPMPQDDIQKITLAFRKRLNDVDVAAAKKIVELMDAIITIAAECDKDTRGVANEYVQACKLLAIEVPADIKNGYRSRCGRFIAGSVCIEKYKTGTTLAALAAKEI